MPADHPGSWYAATANAHRAFPPLRGEVRADVCVVGGGYTGLSAALHLAERGYEVALLDCFGEEQEALARFQSTEEHHFVQHCTVSRRAGGIH